MAGAQPEIDRDPNLAAVHMLADRAFAIAGYRAALGGDLDAADRDRQPIALGLLAGLADRHDDAAPIGVACGNRGLDQGRVGDREPDPPRRPVVFGAGDLDRDEFLGALAIAGELLREINRDVREGATEISEPRIVGAGDGGVFRLAGGAQQQGIAGRGIAVDRDAVE